MGSRQVAPGLTVHNDAGVSHTRVDNAISALLEHPGIAAHLAKYPLNVIIGKNTTGTGGHGGGLYQSAKTVGDIKLAATAHVNLIERMSAGRYSPSLSGEAKTADEKNATTLIHEVGHHVHQTTIPVGMKMHEHPEAVASHIASAGRRVSTYSGENPAEHFAENFTAMHTMTPVQHERRSPEGSRFIREHLASHGFGDQPRDEHGRFTAA